MKFFYAFIFATLLALSYAEIFGIVNPEAHVRVARQFGFGPYGRGGVGYGPRYGPGYGHGPYGGRGPYGGHGPYGHGGFGGGPVTVTKTVTVTHHGKK